MAAYASWIYDAVENFKLAIHAWVFMTKHAHLLVTPGSDNAISNGMHFLGRYYVCYFNYQHSRTGLVADPADYLCSSYRANAFDQKMEMWSPHDEDLGDELITDIRHALNTGFNSVQS